MRTKIDLFDAQGGGGRKKNQGTVVVPLVRNLLTNNAIFGTVAGAFTRECGFSTIVWLLLSKQSEKSGIPQSAMYLAETVHLKVGRNR